MNQTQQLLERLERRSGPIIDLGLDRTLSLLSEIGNPHLRLPPVVHIAGTNGKGSLCAYLTAIAEAADLRVHRYTSPHLVRFGERIRCAGTDISDQDLKPYLETLIEPAEHIGATFFETTTAAAFLAFADVSADVLILETGLGGRLDATNVVAKPFLTALTPISYDHQAFLGTTLSSIAGEKAGILKQEVPCVVAHQEAEALAVIMEAAESIQAPLLLEGRNWEYESSGEYVFYRSDEWNVVATPSLAGPHQHGNAALAVACAEQLSKPFGISTQAAATGIANAVWPARLQRLDPSAYGLRKTCALWLDGGHNPAAGHMLADWLSRENRRVDLIWGMVRDKDAAGFLDPVRPYLRRICCIPIPDYELSATPEALRFVAGDEAFTAPDLFSGLRLLSDESTQPCDILIAGSLYLAGHVLTMAGKTEGG